jgi:hypothetical protein
MTASYEDNLVLIRLPAKYIQNLNQESLNTFSHSSHIKGNEQNVET